MGRVSENELNRLFASLRRIERSIGCISTGGGGDPTNPQIEGIDPILYCDDTCGITGAIAFQTDETTGDLITIYLDSNFQITGTMPLGEPCSLACAPTGEQQVICLCDDVNGDGSLVNSFRRVVQIGGTGTVTLIGDYLPDYSATYTPTGTIIDCSDIGVAAQLVQRRTHLTGVNNWVRPNTVTAMTIFIRRVGDVTNPITITDNNGTITPCYTGDSMSWGIPDGSFTLLQGTFSITMPDINDIVTIQYLELI